MAMVAIASSCACLPPGIRDGSRSSNSKSSTFSQVRCRALILCSGMEIHRLSEEKPAPSGTMDLSEEEKPAPSASSSRTISIFWDLDNKPPTTSPFAAAMHLKMAASAFGSVRETLAFANRHAFSYVPQWVRDERRERKILDILEKKGAVKPTSPYLCSLCGRKCKTNLDLKKHFKQLHERERQKRINRLGQLKGKKRTKFRDAISAKEERYREASRDVILPKRGCGLAQELRRAGVFVRTVEDKPQAADEAIKRRMTASLGGAGVDCVCLVSDDSDFGEMLRDARARRLRTVVIGETKALHRYADAWLSWDEVAAGAARRRAAQAAKRWDAQEALARELLLDDRDEREAMVDEDLKHLDYRSRLLLLDSSSSSMDLREEGGGLLMPSSTGIRPAARIWTSAFSDAEEDDEEQEGFFGEEEETEDSDDDRL